jgi:hypothetical protein
MAEIILPWILSRILPRILRRIPLRGIRMELCPAWDFLYGIFIRASPVFYAENGGRVRIAA